MSVDDCRGRIECSRTRMEKGTNEETRVDTDEVTSYVWDSPGSIHLGVAGREWLQEFVECRRLVLALW